jgi:hypothetical protein
MVSTEELFNTILQETQSDREIVCELVERMAPGRISSSECSKRVPLAKAECRTILLASYPAEVPFDPVDDSNKIIKHLTEGQIVCPLSRILGWDFFVTEDGPKFRAK